MRSKLSRVSKQPASMLRLENGEKLNLQAIPPKVVSQLEIKNKQKLKEVDNEDVDINMKNFDSEAELMRWKQQFSEANQ